MADDLTADDLRRSARHYDEGGVSARLHQAADLMDHGWRLTPSPQSGARECGHAEHVRVRRIVGRQLRPEWRGRAAVGESWEPCKEPPQPGTVTVAARLTDPGAAVAALSPPPQPGTVTELDLIVFLEWLDSTRQVTEWGDPNATHEDTAREYLAQAAPSGTVTVSPDDLRMALTGARNVREMRAQEAARLRLAAALAEAGHDH